MKVKKILQRDHSLCIINNIPTPYRRSLFDEIAREVRETGVEFSVLYLAETETVRNWKVELRSFEKVLPIIWQKRNNYTTTSDVIINVRYLMLTLHKKNVVLFGYNYFTYLVVASARALLRRPTHLFCETTLFDGTSSGWKKILKSLLLRVVFDHFIVPGKRSAEYLVAHGVDQKDISYARNSSSMYPSNPSIFLQPPTLRLLFVGRLAPEKKILNFVQVFAKLSTRHSLSVVGEGPDKNKISKIAASHPQIEMLGSFDPIQLPRIYACHDVLILVSEKEPWGLVVNEAINFGLALLLSPQVGCAPDLLDENGEYLEYITVKHISLALKKIEDNLMRYRQKSLRIANISTVSQQAKDFLASIKGN